MSAVGAAAVCTTRGARARPLAVAPEGREVGVAGRGGRVCAHGAPNAHYSFEAGFFLAAFGAGAFAFATLRRFRRALSFFWLMRRRIFIERRLSRLPIVGGN
jgi:hypothetical protein